MSNWIEETERQIMAEEAAKAQRETEIKLATLASRAVVTDRIFAVNAEVERKRLQREQEILAELELLNTIHDVRGMLTDIKDKFFPDARVIAEVNPEWRRTTSTQYIQQGYDPDWGSYGGNTYSTYTDTTTPSMGSVLIVATQSTKTVEDRGHHLRSGHWSQMGNYVDHGYDKDAPYIKPYKYFDTTQEFTLLRAGIAYFYSEIRDHPNNPRSIDEFRFYCSTDTDSRRYRSYPNKSERFALRKQEHGDKTFDDYGNEIPSIPSLNDYRPLWTGSPREGTLAGITNKPLFQRDLLDSARKMRG